MIRFTALGTRFRLHPLAILAPLVAAFMGLRAQVYCLMLALCVHELAHLWAARLLGVEIREILLLPFGGSVRMENPYALSTNKLFLTAAAGPLANLLLAVIASAACDWGWLDSASVKLICQPLLLLAFFNLLPALPLDGGRMLYALMRTKLGATRAQRIGCSICIGLAAILIAGALASLIYTQRLNLVPLLAAVFLLSSLRDEREALSAARIAALAQGFSEDSSPRPARIYQLPHDARACDALKLVRPREAAWFVLTANGAPHSVIDSRSLSRALIDEKKAADAPLDSFSTFHLTKQRAD